MSNTPNLTLPYIDQNQSQKHVTHNEALTALDAIVQLSVIDNSLTAPPASPADGDRYIVAAAPSGAWSSKAGYIAAWQGGAWMFYAPKSGWLAWVASLSAVYVWKGAAWAPLVDVGSPMLLAKAAHGGKIEAYCAEELITLTGATTNSSVLIPNGALLFAVSNRVVTPITGAASYSCGTSGSPSWFGSSLGVGVGATNRGLIGPNPFYSDTPVLYTAAGGNFTGGQLRMTIHYLMPAWADA
jgi:hypothetical protein